MKHRLGLPALFLLALGVAGQAQAVTKLRMVEVLTSPERTKLMNGLLADFKKQNPDIDVELISMPWSESYQKLLTMVQGGQAPDVAEISDNWLGLYSAMNALENLEPYLKSWPGTAQLTPTTLQAARSANKTAYYVPHGFFLRALFYNKKMFAEAGIKAPPKTLDEFYKTAEKLTKSGPNRYGFCLRGGRGSFDTVYMMMAASMNNGAWFDKNGVSTFDNPEAAKGIALLRDLYKNGYAPKASVNWGFNEIVSGFATQQCGMLDQDPDALVGIRDQMGEGNFAVAPMPIGPRGTAFPKYGTAGWTMFSASKNKPAAWKLMSFLMTKQNGLQLTKFMGIIPTFKGADQDPYYDKPVFKGWFQEIDSRNHKYSLFPYYLPQLGDFFSSVATDGFQQVLLGQKTPEALAKEWAAYLTKAQQQYMKR
jgi:multiple sugar transport system substrate-binding protein